MRLSSAVANASSIGYPNPSLSDGNMDLEILGSKTMNAPIDSIGDVLNYSLRQVPGESRFKHGYLVQYKNPSKIFIEGTSVVANSLKRYIENIQNKDLKLFFPTPIWTSVLPNYKEINKNVKSLKERYTPIGIAINQ